MYVSVEYVSKYVYTLYVCMYTLMNGGPSGLGLDTLNVCMYMYVMNVYMHGILFIWYDNCMYVWHLPYQPDDNLIFDSFTVV